MGLTEKQLQAAFLLASGMQSKKVAEKVGVTPATICTWKNLKSFQLERNRFLRQIYDESLENLLRLNAQAIETVGAILSGGGTDDTKLQAAKLVFAATGLTAPYSGESFHRLALSIGSCSAAET